MAKKSKYRVVVDTNCWISFLIGRRLTRLVDLLSDERVQLVVCDELLAEIHEVTQRPKFARYFPEKEVDSLIEFMLIISEHYEPQQVVRLCRDEADDYLLSLALESHAHFLITGDQDLLVLSKVGSCRIVDVVTFEQIFYPNNDRLEKD